MSYLWLLTIGNTAVSDLGPLHALASLEILSVDGTPVTSLSSVNGLPFLHHIGAANTRIAAFDLDSLPSLQELYLDDGVLTSLGNIERLQPLIMSVTHDPLDADALATIGRLCQVGWNITWDGGSCGSACDIRPDICLPPVATP
jgi:hypothetical protein